MKILVLNCGSSSIKYQLIDMDNNATLLAKGLLERIGLEMGEFTHKPVGKDKYYVQQPIPDHKAGIKMVLEALVDEKIGVIASLTEINACGHRVAHGGEIFKQSVLVGEKEKEQIRALFALAPLHNPANLQGIEAMQAILPNVPQVAVFDTSFHQSMPAEAYLYAIPYEYYQTDKVRRYGFHGTSHRFVAPKAAKMAGLDINNSKCRINIFLLILNSFFLFPSPKNKAPLKIVKNNHLIYGFFIIVIILIHHINIFPFTFIIYFVFHVYFLRFIEIEPFFSSLFRFKVSP